MRKNNIVLGIFLALLLVTCTSSLDQNKENLENKILVSKSNIRGSTSSRRSGRIGRSRSGSRRSRGWHPFPIVPSPPPPRRFPRHFPLQPIVPSPPPPHFPRHLPPPLVPSLPPPHFPRHLPPPLVPSPPPPHFPRHFPPSPLVPSPPPSHFPRHFPSPPPLVLLPPPSDEIPDSPPFVLPPDPEVFKPPPPLVPLPPPYDQKVVGDSVASGSQERN